MAFVFADTIEAKADNTVKVLDEAGRCAGTTPTTGDHCLRVRSPGITAFEYGQAVPVLVTTLEQLQEHGAGAAAAGRTGEQMLAAAFDNSTATPSTARPPAPTPMSNDAGRGRVGGHG
ncbi:hypothetical protein [Streptomyces xanthochromogenes]|uniref:hypothetical protein n=1 Tax=Streptomyces xanthochromogenes TaxID=67384 RepID=UPI0034283CAA